MLLLLSVCRILASYFWRILWDHKCQFLGLMKYSNTTVSVIRKSVFMWLVNKWCVNALFLKVYWRIRVLLLLKQSGNYEFHQLQHERGLKCIPEIVKVPYNFRLLSHTVLKLNRGVVRSWFRKITHRHSFNYWPFQLIVFSPLFLYMHVQNWSIKIFSVISLYAYLCNYNKLFGSGPGGPKYVGV